MSDVLASLGLGLRYTALQSRAGASGDLGLPRHENGEAFVEIDGYNFARRREADEQVRCACRCRGKKKTDADLDKGPRRKRGRVLANPDQSRGDW